MKMEIKNTTTYLIDNEEEALEAIEYAKNSQGVDGYILNKYKNDFKIKKIKGQEPIEYYMLTIEKKFPVENAFFGIGEE